MVAVREKLAARGCSILVVTQARPETLSHYLSRSKWTVPFVADPDRVVYRAFGLERASWLTFLNPIVIGKYLLGMLRGYGAKMPYVGEDVLQLGGDFILDRRRRVIFAYASANPTDRPRPAAILAALASAVPMNREIAPDAPHIDPTAERN